MTGIPHVRRVVAALAVALLVTGSFGVPSASASAAPSRTLAAAVAATSATGSLEPTGSPEPTGSVPPTGSVEPTASNPPTETPRFVVVIDPGHQTVFPKKREPLGPGSTHTCPQVAVGTFGRWTRVRECVRNLQVALRLRAALKARGVTVVMTRTSNDVNVSNARRARMANDVHADLVIHLHCDGADSASAHGITTLTPGKNRWTGPIYSKSTAAAKLVSAAVIKTTRARNRGISYRTDLVGFNWSTVPTILVEMGFMTNRTEDRLLGTSAYQDKIVAGITAGTMRYLASH